MTAIELLQKDRERCQEIIRIIDSLIPLLQEYPSLNEMLGNTAVAMLRGEHA